MSTKVEVDWDECLEQLQKMLDGIDEDDVDKVIAEARKLKCLMPEDMGQYLIGVLCDPPDREYRADKYADYLASPELTEKLEAEVNDG